MLNFICIQVLEKYYLDPKVLTAVEISALKVRVFSKKMTKTSRKPHAETTKDPRFNVSP